MQSAAATGLIRRARSLVRSLVACPAQRCPTIDPRNQRAAEAQPSHRHFRIEPDCARNVAASPWPTPVPLDRTHPLGAPDRSLFSRRSPAPLPLPSLLLARRYLGGGWSFPLAASAGLHRCAAARPLAGIVVVLLLRLLVVGARAVVVSARLRVPHRRGSARSRFLFVVVRIGYTSTTS
jgi:hypothetical protein